MASNSTSSPKNPTTTPPPPPPPPPPTATTTVATKPSSLPPPIRPTSQPRTPQFVHHPYHPHPQPQPPPQQPHHHIQPGLFHTQAQAQTHFRPHDPIRYPLASSGRGLLPTARSLIHPQLTEQLHNSGVHFQHQHSNHVVRGTFLHPSSNNNAHVSPVSAPGVPAVRGVHPQPKVCLSPYSAPENNAPPIDKGADDAVVTLRDRKVRISEGASLYALCRSWLRNGYLEENQPQYGDVLKSLAKPLPLPLPLPPHESSSPKRKERDDETEADEVENLEEIDPKELLSRHVKRAKKIRARLREERLQRIERYKSRLVLLLPHSVQD